MPLSFLFHKKIITWYAESWLSKENKMPPPAGAANNKMAIDKSFVRLKAWQYKAGGFDDQNKNPQMAWMMGMVTMETRVVMAKYSVAVRLSIFCCKSVMPTRAAVGQPT